ncbi:MAG: rod shape-determining protein MreC [Bacteroidales bacterium]|nr:rod shape-determining protein MreC [Muribaculaceae bacterium]MCI6856392.1 rod shape-determining protein MreC [Bacteroidales bacterium]MDY4942931.1 rod shape-determining protein MreC [Candidatus Limisoma sp.]MDD7603473.1 rod shape-determining protein MreC [Bacteroidales bacterium]MDD7760710.1 rod shape-determining protein MreC [Bacteroidales bacterium]
MRNLIDFIVRHSAWFVFAILVTLSCIMLFQNNPYQQSVYLTSASRISSSVYKLTSSVTSYFNLQSINADLQQRNALLEMEVINLKHRINDYRIAMSADSINLPDSVAQQYEYHFATVINNSVSKPMNYITIDKGRLDGIEPEMGVVDQNGVVGIVSSTSDHAARIISLLNPNMRLSCKVKNSDYFGSLFWDGGNPYYCVLEEMPKHVKYHKGDTIITSGFSSVFPEGLIVGTIESGLKAKDDNFHSLRIKLSTDFTRLSTVRAIKSTIAAELRTIETEE